MGNGQSSGSATESENVSPTLTDHEVSPLTDPDKPWRRTQGWDKTERSDLKDRVAGLAPITREQFDVPYLNVVLTGQIGAGKSSFYNSLNSIYNEKIISDKGVTGIAANSLTKEFQVYHIKPDSAADPLPWRICDTMGLDPGVGVTYDVTNILKAVDGHVPSGFKFPNQEVILKDTPEYIVSPELKDRAHCVAVVINGHLLKKMEPEMKRKLTILREGLIARKIPTFIVLTHIDEACDEVAKDVKNVYRSVAIRDLVHKVGRMLHGLPENQVFPVMNYKKEVELEDDMDILLLTALRQMLYSAQGHLDNNM